jgi:hypothetical protein
MSPNTAAPVVYPHPVFDWRAISRALMTVLISYGLARNIRYDSGFALWANHRLFSNEGDGRK